MTYPGYLNSIGMSMIETIQVRCHHPGKKSWNGVQWQGRFFLWPEAKAPSKKFSPPSPAIDMQIFKPIGDMVFGHFILLRYFLPGIRCKCHPD
jgi:hypothetical protein